MSGSDTIESLKAELQHLQSRYEVVVGDLEDLSYLISHDLQAPLISINGYAAELLEDYGSQLTPEGRFCLDRLKANTKHIQELVMGLLELSRLNTRRHPFTVFDANEAGAEVVTGLAELIGLTGAQVTLNHLPSMFGDRERLIGVFKNLLVNALSYGGTQVTVGFSAGTWFVSDNGIGIPASQLEKIFAPGERLKEIETDGIGLGLTYCRKVLIGHGGKIWAESDGDGSVFYFTIARPSEFQNA